jgi:hypothetical protein
MFPNIASQTQGVTNAATATHTINLPAGIVAGDLIIAFIQNSAFNQTVPTEPVGWEEIYYEGFTGGAAWPATMIVYARVATGTEGATLTFNVPGGLTTTQTAYVTVRIAKDTFGGGTNISWTTNADWNHARTNPTNAVNPDPPNLASGFTGGDDTLWIAVSWQEGAAVVSAYPAGYTGGATSGLTSGNLSVALANRKVTAASEDPGVFTRAAGRWVGQTWAIRGLGNTPNVQVTGPYVLDDGTVQAAVPFQGVAPRHHYAQVVPEPGSGTAAPRPTSGQIWPRGI